MAKTKNFQSEIDDVADQELFDRISRPRGLDNARSQRGIVNLLFTGQRGAGAIANSRSRTSSADERQTRECPMFFITVTGNHYA
jgi:hypothetical protein